MKGEYGSLRSQLRGYLFEKVIMEMLRKNNFIEVDVLNEPADRVRELRRGFVEFKGRGCWHQIDCPCDYGKDIPFLYPIRLLGEVKFYKSPLEKKHIREFIGVIKDIQENYFVTAGAVRQDFSSRKMEIGVYFSANGFQEEAEKLAYAHGIKTISYENNYLLNKIKQLIAELERNYLSIKCIRNDIWNEFWDEFEEAIRNGNYEHNQRRHFYWNEGYRQVLEEIRQSLMRIRSSFIATTATGVFLHFVSDYDFPEDLFRQTDEGLCRVYYNHDNYGKRYFWLEINGDDLRRRFYFTPPQSLDEEAVYGRERVLDEKGRVFRVLKVNITLSGIVRNLTLRLDDDWLNDTRNRRFE